MPVKFKETIKNRNGSVQNFYMKSTSTNELKEALDNNKLLLNSSIQTNSDYRKYMTRKATIIRDHNMRYLMK